MEETDILDSRTINCSRSRAMQFDSCVTTFQFQLVSEHKDDSFVNSLLQRLFKGRAPRMKHSKLCPGERNATPLGLRVPLFQSWQRRLYGVSFYVNGHLSFQQRSEHRCHSQQSDIYECDSRAISIISQSGWSLFGLESWTVVVSFELCIAANTCSLHFIMLCTRGAQAVSRDWTNKCPHFYSCDQ